MEMLLTEGRALWSSRVVAFGRSGLDKKREATQDDSEVCTIHYLSTDGTTEEYYADEQTIIEKNGIVECTKEVVAQKSSTGSCLLFFATKAFRCLGGGCGIEEEGVSLNVDEAQWQVRKGCGR